MDEEKTECTRETGCIVPMAEPRETAGAADEALAASLPGLSPDRPEEAAGAEAAEADTSSPETAPSEADRLVQTWADFVPVKRSYWDYGQLCLKQSRMNVILILLAAAVFTAGLLLRLLLGWRLALPGAVLASLFLFYSLFFGRIWGSGVYRIQRRQLEALEGEHSFRYVFLERFFDVAPFYGSQKTDYADIRCVSEGDLTYALQTKAHVTYIIPKVGLEPGMAEAFGEYIAEKTDCPYRYRRTKARWGLRTVLFVLLALAMLVGSLLPEIPGYRRLKATVYTAPGFAITLPGSFQQGSYPGFDFYAETTECAVYAGSVTKEEARYYFGTEATLELYAASIARRRNAEEANTKTAEDGSCRMASVMSSNGTDYLLYDIVKESGDSFWQITMACRLQDANRMIPKFDSWADTIQLK